MTDDIDGMARLWSEVLKVERLPHDADFFDYGGQSVLAARLISRVERDFGIRLTLDDIFDNVTVAEFAAVVAERVRDRPTPA
jgi:acyl carrier protein